MKEDGDDDDDDDDNDDINFIKTKRNLLYIRTQSVPLCKHFPSRL